MFFFCDFLKIYYATIAKHLPNREETYLEYEKKKKNINGKVCSNDCIAKIGNPRVCCPRKPFLSFHYLSWLALFAFTETMNFLRDTVSSSIDASAHKATHFAEHKANDAAKKGTQVVEEKLDKGNKTGIFEVPRSCFALSHIAISPAPAWVPDSSSTKCTACEGEFTTLNRRVQLNLQSLTSLSPYLSSTTAGKKIRVSNSQILPYS